MLLFFLICLISRTKKWLKLQFTLSSLSNTLVKYYKLSMNGFCTFEFLRCQLNIPGKKNMDKQSMLRTFEDKKIVFCKSCLG
jgi:hypothetical protein